MCLLAISLNIMLSSLVAALARSPDTKGTTTCPDKLEVHVHGSAQTLDMMHPPEEYDPQFRPLRAQPTLPQMGWHMLGIAITAILLVSAAYSLWGYLNGAQGSRSHSSHQPGRSDAVPGIAPREDRPPQLDGNHVGPPPRRHRSAAVVLADSAPHPAPPLRQSTDPPSPLIEEPLEELDHCAANQGVTTPVGNRFQHFVATGRHVRRTRSWPPIGQRQSAVVCLSVRPAHLRSLRRALYTGSSDLSRHLDLDQYIFFVVGVNIHNQEDAENDAKYLQQMFESLPRGSLQYECVYGRNATRVKIRKTVRTLLGDAQAVLEPRVFMLFTGTGDKNNMMYLSNDKPLSESDLYDWLSPFTDPTNETTVGVLFDICREGPRLAVVSQSVEVAWSCSTEEFAFAISFAQEDKLFPRSIFLLAIFLAAHHTNIHKQDECFFEAAFASHIKQLREFIRLMYDREHQGRCPRCPLGRLCDPPVAQNPDLQHGRRAVTDLGMVIATHFPQHAREVFDEVDRRMQQLGFPERLCASNVAQFSAGRDRRQFEPRMKGRFASVESGKLFQTHRIA